MEFCYNDNSGKNVTFREIYLCIVIALHLRVLERAFTFAYEVP